MQEGFIFGFEVIEHIKYEFSCYIHEYFHVILYISIDQIFTLEIKQISLPSIYCLEYSFMNRYIFSKVKTYTVKPRNTRYPNTRNSNCTFFSGSLQRAIAALTPDASMFSQLHVLRIETSQDIF